jgi:hypothetical protein
MKWRPVYLAKERQGQNDEVVVVQFIRSPSQFQKPFLLRFE